MFALLGVGAIVAMSHISCAADDGEANPETIESGPAVVDYTQRSMLAGVNGTTPGIVSYHGQPRFITTIRKSIELTPDGGYVLWDAEPWTKNHEGKPSYRPWYGTATEEENARMFGEYARTIWKLAPELRRRDITLQIYSAPIFLQRNWTRIWRPKDHPHYEEWEARQLRVLNQAEEAGMLPALRACYGKVAIVFYVPRTWDEPKRHHWTLKAIETTASNLHDLLVSQDVPHVFLIRPDYSQKMLDAVVPAVRPHGMGVWFFDRPYEGGILDAISASAKKD